MIRVMGAGAFGTALACAFSSVHPVVLWSHDADQAHDMQNTRENTRRLPGIRLPDPITIRADQDGAAAEVTILAVPTQKLRRFCQDNKEALQNGGPLVICCKGVELSTGARPSQIVAETLPDAEIAVLTGPSFASDIARGMPTALTLACHNDQLGADLQNRLTTPVLRLYRTTDVTGAELGGALKNVIAIGCGAAIGAGLGESARAALMTRGFSEMTRTAQLMGANPATLNGLSGFGDLVLTCGSTQSRNFRFGHSLGLNEPFSDDITVEGVATAAAMAELSDKQDLDLPITRAITRLARRELQVHEAIDMLLSRPLKEETC